MPGKSIVIKVEDLSSSDMVPQVLLPASVSLLLVLFRSAGGTKEIDSGT